MNEKELERLWASVSPLVEKMKAKYPKELNLEGLEPVLTHDICMIVRELDKQLKEEILKNKIQYCLDDICSMTEYAIPVDKLLEIFNNHA